MTSTCRDETKTQSMRGIARTKTMAAIFIGVFNILMVVAIIGRWNSTGDLRGNEPLGPRVFTAEPLALLAARASYQNQSDSDSSLGPALERLLDDADAALAVTPPTVTEKRHTPPSGNIHDYLSRSPHSWLDPQTGNYVIRVGQPNPEAEVDSDAVRLRTVSDSSQTLALTFYVSGNDTYGCRAAHILRTFFLNATTRMNPNLYYAGNVPGTSEVTREGLTVGRVFPAVVDAVGMLAESPCWTAWDQDAMLGWMQSYLTWLLSTDLASKSDDVNGDFYEVQAIALSLFVGRDRLAGQLMSEVAARHVGQAVSGDGQPVTEQSLAYSVVNLPATVDLAFLAGRRFGVDLWSDGHLEAGLTSVARYGDPGTVWPLQQVAPLDRTELTAVLMRVAVHYPQNACLRAALAKREVTETSAARVRLLFTTQPRWMIEVLGDLGNECPDVSAEPD